MCWRLRVLRGTGPSLSRKRPLAYAVSNNALALSQTGLCVCVCVRVSAQRARRIYGSLPCLVLQVMRHRAAVIYDLSARSGSSVDSEATVLQILTAGAIMSVAREARAKEHENTVPVPDQALLASLRDPLLVVGLPKGWYNKKKSVANSEGIHGTKTSRVWSFVCTDHGVRVNRSKGLSIGGALDYMLAGVLHGAM